MPFTNKEWASHTPCKYIIIYTFGIKARYVILRTIIQKDAETYPCFESRFLISGLVFLLLSVNTSINR